MTRLGAARPGQPTGEAGLLLLRCLFVLAVLPGFAGLLETG